MDRVALSNSFEVTHASVTFFGKYNVNQKRQSDFQAEISKRQCGILQSSLCKGQSLSNWQNLLHLIPLSKT